MNKLLTIPFHDKNLFLVEHNGEPLTPMKSIVDGMGLTWQSQHRKLTSNAKRWGITILMIPTESGIQEALCMPLRKLFGWLSTVSPNKVKPELKERITWYQNECDDVLWQYWQTLEKNKAPQKDPRALALQQQRKLMRTMSELKKSLDKAALEGEYIAASSSKLPTPELTLNYPDRFQGKDYLSHSELYPGTWDVNLLGLICNLELYEGRAVPVQVSGLKVLKRELMSLLLLVDTQARKLHEINKLTTH